MRRQWLANFFWRLSRLAGRMALRCEPPVVLWFATSEALIVYADGSVRKIKASS